MKLHEGGVVTAADMNTWEREPLAVHRPPKFEINLEFKNPDPALIPLLFNGVPVHKSAAVPENHIYITTTTVDELMLAETIRKQLMFGRRYGRTRRMGMGIDDWAAAPVNFGGVIKFAPLPTRRGKIKKEIAKQRKLLKLLDRFGDEDPFNDEAVLAVDIRFPDRATTYHYAAVRAAGEWYLTGSGRNNEGPYSWEGFVLDFLARGEEVHVFFANTMTEVGGK